LKRTARFSIILILLGAMGTSCLCARPTPSPIPTLTPVPRATPDVIVDGAITYQTIDGFGACGAFRAASHIHGSTGLSPDQQKAVLDLLFSPTTGAGLSIWRNEIGSSSTAGVGGPDDGDNVPSIEPNDPGGPDAPPDYSWDGDDGDQVWLSQQAQSYGVTQFYATAWSAPAYMKTNNDLKNGGYLCGIPGQTCSSGDWRQHYADYLVQYLKFYQDAGIQIDYVGFQNEPDLSPGYTGMNWDASHVSGDRGRIDMSTPQNIDFIKNYLGPTLAQSGLSTEIACCEATSWPRTITYANGVLADPEARDYIGLITGHGYYATSAGMLESGPVDSAIDAGKRVWQTEAASFDYWNAAWDGGSSDSSGIHWAEALWDSLVNAQVNAYFYWWGAKAYEAGGTTANSPLIKIVEDTYEPSKRFWAFANYSRFIRPGATRIDASAGESNLRVSAFGNTDGSYAIVVLNLGYADDTVTFSLQNVTAGDSAVPYLTNATNDAAQQPSITISDGTLTADVPARSLVTLYIEK
jgi:glucuronoarabinoxylan endo-1,4-beta-xylanase